MTRFFILAVLLVGALAASARAQVGFVEVEPNSVKSQATLALGILPGDTLTGVSTGSATGVGLSTVASADYWDIRPPIQAPAIYCYSLDVSTIPAVDVTKQGVSQINGSPNPARDVATQSDPASGSPPSTSVWYGFGKAEQHYIKVTGSASTTGSYLLTYSCTPLTPAQTTEFKEGTLTVTTIGQGHGTNTELQLFNSAFVPLAGGHNDDYLPGATTQSRVDVTLTAGIYYVAVSDYNMSTNLSDASATEANQNGNLLDFADLIVNGSTAGSIGSPLNISFSISDGVTTFPVVASKTAPYRIFWATFTVETPTIVFCPGDGTGTACPCGNSGSAGNGCANSTNPGGAAMSNSGLASIAADSLMLVGSGITGPGLFFQGTGTSGGGNGIAFGDGLLCPGGIITRLVIVIPVAGMVSYPGPVHAAGGVVAPGTFRYQCWYRDAGFFCTANQFNLSNGTTVTWIP